jgi:hypothetical protein
VLIGRASVRRNNNKNLKVESTVYSWVRDDAVVQIEMAMVGVKRRSPERFILIVNRDEGIHYPRLNQLDVSGMCHGGTQYRGTSDHHDRLEVCGSSVVSVERRITRVLCSRWSFIPSS